MELFRPVLDSEFTAIEENQFCKFPRCRSEQPLFTALLSEIGASQIARHMKTAPGQGNIVRVMRFIVDDAYIRQFPVQNADDPERQAIWIAAEEMEILNQHLVGKISVVDSFQADPRVSNTFFA